MRLLLDTHVFRWYISGDARLPAAYVSAIQDPANEVYLSVASIWEAVISVCRNSSKALAAKAVTPKS